MRHLILVCLLAALVACNGDDPPPGFGTMSIAMNGEGSDVAHIRLDIVSSGGDCVAGPTVHTSTVALASGEHDAEDSFIVAAGAYLVCATPLQEDLTPSEHCPRAEAPATVVAGQTTDVTLISECHSDDNGGINVNVGINTPPSVVDVDVSPSTYFPLCETLAINIDVEDPDADMLAYSWAVTSEPAGATPVLDATTDDATFSTDTLGDYEITVSVDDGYAAPVEFTFGVHAVDGDCSTTWLAPSSGAIEAQSVVASASGAVVVGGTFAGVVNLGSGAVSAPVGRDAIVAQYDTAGTLQWTAVGEGGSALQFGDEESIAVAVTPTGDPLVAVRHESGDLSWGCQSHSGTTGEVVVAKLSRFTGACIWSVQLQSSIGPDHRVATVDVTSDPGGNAIVSLRLAASAGPGSLTVSPLPTHFFRTVGGAIAKLDGQDGAGLWLRTMGEDSTPDPLNFGGAAASDVRVDSQGDVVAVLYSWGNAELDDGTPVYGFRGSPLVVKLDGLDGNVAWLANINLTTTSLGAYAFAHIALDDSDDVWLGLTGHDAVINLGGEDIDRLGVAKLDGGTGFHVFSRAALVSESTVATTHARLAVAPNGDVVVTFASGEMDAVSFGGAALTPAHHSVVVFGLSPDDGDWLWHRTGEVGGTDAQSPRISVDGLGGVVVTAPVQFATAPMTFDGASTGTIGDLFLAKFTP